jgi:hypothetical protein
MGHFSNGVGYSRKLEEVAYPCQRRLSDVKPELKPAIKALAAPVASCYPEDVKTSSPDHSNQLEQKDAEIASPEAEPNTESAIVAGQKFVDGLGVVLTSWIEAAAVTPGKPPKITRFHSAKPPGMNIDAYLKRIRKYFLCSDECFVLALVYIDRVSKIDPSMTVCALTGHRLLFTSVMLAAKFQDDTYYSNAYYAKVGGLSLSEVNMLEAAMLKQLDWKMLVSPKVYELYHSLVCDSA